MPKILMVAMLAAILAPISAAQMRGRSGVAIGGNGFRHFRGRGYGYPFFYSDFGDLGADPPPSPAPIERKVIQPERPTEPLLIEWQGDHFVRYGGAQTGPQSPDYAEGAAGTAASQVRSEIPPAVLIYRDGHREEVSDYVITRGVLYARGDGYSQASRNIQLSALDIPGTFRANQDSRVKFVLPQGPNEVVTRP